MKTRIRFRPIVFEGKQRTVYKAQFHQVRAPGGVVGTWHDEFIAPFDSIADAKLWCRRCYGSDQVEFVEYEE